jgi:catechol 2,3-dioxygenase-like lactoylglutathione lyase family enzyme
MLITGFDHVVIAVRDLDAGAAAYEALLGRKATAPEVRDGAATALIATDNIAVELMAPHGEGETADRLRAALKSGEGLKSLVFTVDDIARMHRRVERVALAPGPLNEREGWTSFRADAQRTNGARLFFLQRHVPLVRDEAGADAVTGLDHIVIRSNDADRAAALYGARLGLDLRLDREVAGRRMLFFRCGDAVLEVAHDSRMTDDALWGLSWRVRDIEAAHARLTATGVPVTAVRPGHKHGTRVFAVTAGTCGVPTLFLGLEGA